MSTTPWSMEKRGQVSRKIAKEAARVADRLGARHVVVIAFFPDGEHMHMQDGGNPPMKWDMLYKNMATAHATLVERGEGWIS